MAKSESEKYEKIEKKPKKMSKVDLTPKKVKAPAKKGSKNEQDDGMREMESKEKRRCKY